MPMIFGKTMGTALSALNDGDGTAGYGTAAAFAVPNSDDFSIWLPAVDDEIVSGQPVIQAFIRAGERK